MRSRVKSRALTLLRGALSGSILVLLLSRTSVEALVERVKSGAWLPLTAALCLVLLTAVLVSLRWRALAGWFGFALPTTFAVRAVFLGMFGGQLLPSTVGTDLMRGWIAAQRAGSLTRAAASIVADRLVALFAACLLLAVSYPSLGPSYASLAGFLAPAAVVVSGGVLLVFLAACSGALERAFGGLRTMLPFWNGMDGVVPRRRPIIAAILMAIAIHAIAVAVAALTAAAYGIDASLEIWLSIIPVSIIACAVPVSINGWGVREAVIAGLAAGYGIPTSDALTVSMTLGVLNIVASLPGAYLLLCGVRS